MSECCPTSIAVVKVENRLDPNHTWVVRWETEHLSEPVFEYYSTERQAMDQYYKILFMGPPVRE